MFEKKFNIYGHVKGVAAYDKLKQASNFGSKSCFPFHVYVHISFQAHEKEEAPRLCQMNTFIE